MAWSAVNGAMMADLANIVTTELRHKPLSRQSPIGCAACSNRRPGWFCSLGSAVLADLELATSTISLPSQAPLFKEGEEARCLYLICSGYLKLTAGHANDRQMIVRVAGPGSMLGLYAVLSHGVYEVSAESLTTAQLRPVERERFLGFLRTHKEAQMRAATGRSPAELASLFPNPQLSTLQAAEGTLYARARLLRVESTLSIGQVNHTDDKKNLVGIAVVTYIFLV